MYAHLIATHIEHVTSEGPGFASHTGYFSVDIYQWCVNGLSKALWSAKKLNGCVHLKDPLEPFEWGRRLIVSRLRVSVCHRYVHKGAERRCYASMNLVL